MGTAADPTAAGSKLTYEDYLSLPDDNRRYEILDGDLAVTASPTTIGAPDLLIEILSDSTERRDRGAKMKLYAQFGVDWYWVVDPEARRLEIYQRSGATYALAASHAGNDRVSCAVPPPVSSSTSAGSGPTDSRPASLVSPARLREMRAQRRRHISVDG